MAHILLAIFGISFVMIVHEAGHYLMARASGMRVTAFSIGLGPAIVKYRPKGSPTTFQLCIVPLLAYVRIAGMSPLDEGDPNDDGRYDNKGVVGRALTLLGGPLANYVLASVIVFALALTGWRDEAPSSPMIVAAVAAGSPAELAGVRAGDVVLEVDGQAVRDVREMSERTGHNAGAKTAYVLQRDGKRLPPLTIVPRSANGRGVIGVTAKLETRERQLPVGEAATLAVELPWSMTVQNVAGIADLVKQRTTAGMTGPVGMAKEMATQAKKDAYAFFAVLIAISVGLGLFNLLPLPFLDGGRLLFLVFEVIGGRRPNPNVEAMVHTAGMLLLLSLGAFVTWRDVVG
jgi:regulator of sigma E protease